MPNAIEAKNLNVTIGEKRILCDVSVAISAGQVIGLLGPSGAGKTTLMRAIVGLQKIADGTATVLGRPAASAQLRTQIGYMAQIDSTYPDLTVAENLRYFAAITGTTKQRLRATIEEVELTPQTHQIAGTLSEGQRTRLSLAIALLSEPSLYVLDEPTVGLDPILREKLWGHFHQLAEAGATLLVSSHVMDEARRCDSLLLIHEGKILATGTPDELKAQTRTNEMEEAFIQLVEAAR